MEKKIALSIAGSDPSGGAGIQADLKSFSFLVVHGLTVVTCVTSQNTKQVTQIFPLPVDIIEKQIDTLYEDTRPNAVKTGMLYDAEIIKCVAKKISQYSMKPVVDPIMVSTSGDALSKNDYVSALKKELLPHAYVLTANIPESCELLGKEIQSIEGMENACKELRKLGPKYILLKGGHLDTKQATDVFFDGKKMTNFSLPRISKEKIHGTGCTFSALITGFFALGEEPIEAVRKSKYVLWGMINEGYKIGKGAEVPNHSIKTIPPITIENEHFSVWFELKNAIDNLLTILPEDYIAEVGMNFAYAVKNAKSLEDVCAVDGRIIKTKVGIKQCGDLTFGASKHVASIVLAVMSFDSKIRCALNLRYSQETLECCKKAQLRIGPFDRKDEPKNAKSTMEWGTSHTIKKLGFVPDIIHDNGSIGKEPMIRVLGKDPKEVLYKIQRLLDYRSK